MDLETQEQLRIKHVKESFEAMSAILRDKAASNEDKIRAAKVIDAMSDTIVKAHLMSQQTDEFSKSTNKLTRQLDKLNDDGKGYE